MVVCQKKNESELGNNWQEKFCKFNKNAIKAASLGQVHQAIEKKTKHYWLANYNILTCFPQ